MKRVPRHLWIRGAGMPGLGNAMWTMYHLLHRNRIKNRGEGNLIRLDPQLSCLRKVTFDIEGDHNTIVIEKGTRLEDLTVEIKGHCNWLTIGEKCVIGGGHLSFPDYDGLIEIGQGTTILGVHIVASEPGATISIGEDCLFSFDIDIRSGDSHSIIDLETGERINYGGDITIGDHVWVGAHVQILKGVNIGQGSIIGTGAVVTSDVPTNSVSAGVSAQVVRSGVTWLREKVYLGDHKAPKLKPERHWAWTQRGEALRKSGYYQQALVNFEHALELKPDDAEAWRSRGRTLAKLGRYSDAVASYTTALKLEPRHPDTRRQRAEALAKLRHQRQTLQIAQRPFLELTPSLTTRHSGSGIEGGGRRAREAA
jgi:carbonic anhydrase/acetyltransferase-like protein (isoleucine patch superfamily)